MRRVSIEAAEAKEQIPIDPSNGLAAFLLQTSRANGSGEVVFEVIQGRAKDLPDRFQREIVKIVGLLRLVGATPVGRFS